ncbi:flagellin [Natrinema thermotolerans]|uniref:Flagellin n=1 Tax=Natrinema thermotolerans TaxID=121872 RepID=A0AAF0PC95_9EURY|nr:flagellin [Natrinema thermotolerans]WMT06073.1 flagellin [Natrinema thermotolerans]
MVGERNRDGSQREDSEDRGASPLVGIVLLFALVIMGAMLVFVAGSAMLDAIKSEANSERTQQFAMEIDHRLTTVATTGSDQPLPIDEMQGNEPTITDDGNISVRWYNASSGSRTCAPVEGELRALEFELDDRTIAHQGGGIWEKTDRGVSTVSEPNIGYDNDSLQLQIMELEEDDFGSSGTVARANHSRSTELTETINSRARACSDATSIEFSIENSTYHEGWATYLEDAVGADEYSEVSVTHKPATEAVVVQIENVRTPVDSASLLIESDNGVKGTNGNTQLVEFGDKLEFQATLNNTGSETVSSPTMRVAVDGGRVVSEKGSEAVPSKKKNGGPGNDRSVEDVSVKINSKDYEDHLSPGETYEYTIQTLDKSGEIDDTLEDPGEFYLGEPGSNFTVNDIETTPADGDNATISAEITNIGIEEGDRTVTIDFDEYDVTASEELTLDYGATGTVTWTVNKSALPYEPNEFEVRTGDDTATGTIIGGATGEVEDAFTVVKDNGVGDDQIVTDEGPFTVEAVVENTYADEQSRDVTLTVPDAGITMPEPTTLESGEQETVSFTVDPDEHDLEAGTVYEYNVTAGEEGLSEPGSFYVGKPGTNFVLSNENVTVDENVTITADLTNTGVESGSQTVDLDLEYLDEMPAELEEGFYDDVEINASNVERAFGEGDTVELELNGSNLIAGEYNATISTEDDSTTVSFVVESGIESGRVGLGGVEDATANVTVLASQMSGAPAGGPGTTGEPDQHELAPVNLSVVTERNGVSNKKYEFSNKYGGDNINTYDSWQEKGDTDKVPDQNPWATSINIEEESTLTLAATSSNPIPQNACNDYSEEDTHPDYTIGLLFEREIEFEHTWCDKVEETWIPVDATTGKSLQNVRVRSAENNTVPVLQPANNIQFSADEVLEKEGLWDNENQTLDLDENEFVFLFEMTQEPVDDGDIDSLWNQAQGSGTGDPNFNDLIVHVEVERANVDPSTPSITIMPGGGNLTDVGTGNGSKTGDRPDEVDPSLEGDADEGAGPDVGTGTSDNDVTGGMTGETGVDVDADHIVIG